MRGPTRGSLRYALLLPSALVLAWGCPASGEPSAKQPAASVPATAPPPASPAADEPKIREEPVTPSIVRTEPDITRLADSPDPVDVHGTYRLLDVRQRKKGEPVYLGHAAIELSDGHRVLLEPMWSDRALRTKAERDLDGKSVVATGQLLSKPPEPPEPQAQIVLPTLSPVKSVRASE